jgi:hypothetical protein
MTLSLGIPDTQVVLSWRQIMKAVLTGVLVTLILCGSLLAVTNPVPFVNQPLVPAAAEPGGSGFTLTVNGTGFVSGSVVNWNKSPRSTTFVSGSQLTATILASDIAIPNTAVVTVVNPGPGGGNSNVTDFAIALPAAGIAMLNSRVGISDTLNVSAEVAGDFNGDGNLDLAVSANDPNGSEARVAILLGNGDGTFHRASTIPIQFFAGELITGDFNADGKLDLALITNLNQVSVLLGNGDGTFQPEKDFLTGISPVSILAGDFNQDGNLDLATSNSVDNSISVLLGRGDGTFLAHIDSTTGGVTPYGFAVGDFNIDGKLDLAVTENSSSEVTILLGNGDGTFSFDTELLSLDSPGAVTTADLNGDGKLDLIVGNVNFSGSGSWETVFFGNGDGTFQKGHVVSQSQRSLPEQAATVADMNADGNPDLVLLSGTPNEAGNVSVLLGDGNDAFKFVYDTALRFNEPTGLPAAAVTGDFNNDGRIDVITSSSVTTAIAVLLQSSVVFSPPHVDFGFVSVGSKNTKKVTLTNTDVSALTISKITVTGPFSADYTETNDCPSSLASGSSCTLKIKFKPSEREPEQASIRISDNGPHGKQFLSLFGNGE